MQNCPGATADLGMRVDDGRVDVSRMRDLEGRKIILQAMTHEQRLSLDMLAEGLLDVCKPLCDVLQCLGADAREAGVIICDRIIRDAVLIHQSLQQAS